VLSDRFEPVSVITNTQPRRHRQRLDFSPSIRRLRNSEATIGSNPCAMEPDGLMECIDATFVQPRRSSRKRKPDVSHRRQADDLWTGFEGTQRSASCHVTGIRLRAARLGAGGRLAAPQGIARQETAISWLLVIRQPGILPVSRMCCIPLRMWSSSSPTAASDCRASTRSRRRSCWSAAGLPRKSRTSMW